MADLHLDRLPSSVPVAQPQTGFPTPTYQTWWQKVCESVEQAFRDITTTIAAVSAALEAAIAAQAAADAAQNDANTAQQDAIDALADAAAAQADAISALASAASAQSTADGKQPTSAVLDYLATASAATAAAVKALLALDSVDNTADADKPVSTDQQAALDLKAPLASPTFTGTVRINNAPAASVATVTHSIPINLNGVVYYMLVSSVP